LKTPSEYFPSETEVPLDPTGGWLALLEDGVAIMSEVLPPIVEVVEGIVAEHSKLVIGSGSKSFKTWLTIDLGLSISHDALFLGRRVTRRRVLYVNLELKAATFKRRVQAIAQAKGLKIDSEWFLHLPLRGKVARKELHTIIDQIIVLAKERGIEVVILDPVYKLNTVGDENSSRDQTVFFNELDRLTTDAACTVILNDHFGKGNQSEKDPLDAIRGSSAKGGDVDAAMILRRHDVDGCFRVDLVHRELPPVDPFCIGWEYPLMRLRSDLDPDLMKKAKAGRRKSHSLEKLVAAISDHTAINPISISQWALKCDLARTTLTEYLPALRSKGWVTTVGEGKNARQALTGLGQEIALKWEDDI
jgi:hypothetical protein